MTFSTETILAYSRAFEAMASGQDNFCLVPCRVDGELSLMIVVITEVPPDKPERTKLVIQPLFVAITERMRVTDEDGGTLYGDGGGGGPKRDMAHAVAETCGMAPAPGG